MAHRKTFFFLALWGCTTGAVAGQQDRLSESWRWVAYGPEAGITGPVLSVVEDEAGTMWALRRNGLSWFDGHEWVAVPPEDGVPDLPLAHLDPRAGGGVLVTGSGRLFAGDRAGFREVPLGLPPGTPIWRAASLGPDDFIAATPAGFFRVRDGVVGAGVPPVEPVSILIGLSREAGRVFARDPTGIYEWDGDGWTRLLPLERPHFTAVRVHDDVVLVAEDSNERRGVWRLTEGEAPRFEPIELTPPFSAYAVSPEGIEILVSAFSRVAVRRPDGWAVLDPTPDALTGVAGLRYQSNGDLWAAGPGDLSANLGGPARWARWPIPDVSVNALHFAADGRTWLGTGEGLFVRSPDGAFEPIEQILGQQLLVVTGIEEDPEGGIWITSGSAFTGAFRLHDGQWRRYGPVDGLPPQYYHDVALDGAGTLWFLPISAEESARSAVTIRFDGTFFSELGGLYGQRVYAMTHDDRGYWFGTYEGLRRWDGTEWRHYGVEQGLRADKVFTLHRTADGALWMGHQDDAAGLARLDPATDSIRYVDGMDGLPNAGVWDIEDGARGSLWVSTRAGLGLLTGDGLAVAIGRPEGLAVSLVWPLTARGDSLHLGTIGQGAVSLALGSFPTRAPRVRIAPVEVGEEWITASWRVLPYLGDQPARASRARYRLDGGPWSAWSSERSVRFGGGIWGHHTLEVQSTTLLGALSPPVAARFYAAHPLFRSAIARSLLLFWTVTLALGFGAYAHRRRSHTRELQERERYFRSLIENASDLICVLDSGGRVEYASPAVQHVLGRPADACVGRPLLDHVVDDDRDAVSSAIATATSDEAVGASVVAHFARPDGTLRALELAIRSPATVDGERVTVVNARDRTEQREAEERLRQSAKMEAVGQLTGGIAHDFNNLLTVIIGEIELASFTRERELGTAMRAAERASDLTSRLLAFSRRQPLQPGRVELNALVTELSHLIQRTIGSLVDLEIVTAPEPVFTCVDRTQLDTAILNLCINARDGMDGEGRLSIVVARVHLEPRDLPIETTVEEGDYARITVTDDGVGIPPDIQARVFDPFFTTKDVGEGSGLGLSMVYGFVKQSGGYVTIDSAVGRGTSVHLYLPVQSPDADRGRTSD